jgi:hypothetical protein
MSSDLASLFDVTHVRQALKRRMGSERFRTAVQRRLRQLDDTRLIPDDAVPTEESEQSPVGDKQRRRGGASSSASTLPTALSAEIAQCIQGVKEGLPPKPWHSTLQFVTFDLPKTSAEFNKWMASFVDGEEQSDAVRKSILERNPSMKVHADTDMFMNQVILPFRSYLMAQVIVAVLQLSAKKRPSHQTDALSSSMKVEDEAEISRLERVVDGEERKMPEYASRAHALLHAVDMADVNAIESCLPEDADGLRKIIATRKKQNVCTRYAEYHLHYMTLPEGTDDREWLLRMQPLAESGLVHAQVDVGLCCIALGRIDEGRAWLERASKCNCVSAMLELGRHYFGEAMGWTKKKTALDEERTVEQNVKLALKWLDAACDGPLWDGFSVRDKAQAKQMIQAVEQEAKRYRDYKRAKEFLDKRDAAKRRWQIPLFAILVLILAYFVGQWLMNNTAAPAAFEGESAADVLDPDAAFVRPHLAHLR